MPGGQINDPSSGKLYFLPFLQATPSSPSRTLDSPHALLPELQRYKDTTRCAALGVEVPGHRQQQLTQTLIVRLLKTHFFTLILEKKSQQNRTELVTRHGGGQEKVRRDPGAGSRRSQKLGTRHARYCTGFLSEP